MNLVLDASVALAWVFGDDGHEAAWAVVERLRQQCAAVPTHYPLEVGNGLLAALRRSRLTLDQATSALVLLDALPIEIDAGSPPRMFNSTWTLAIRHGLTTYDAAYLELALRLGQPLATLDQRLARAAVAEQVVLAIDPR